MATADKLPWPDRTAIWRLGETAHLCRLMAPAWHAFEADCEPQPLRAATGGRGGKGGHSDPTPQAAEAASAGLHRLRTARGSLTDVERLSAALWEAVTDRQTPGPIDAPVERRLERVAIIALTVQREWEPTIAPWHHLADACIERVAELYLGPLTTLWRTVRGATPAAGPERCWGGQRWWADEARHTDECPRVAETGDGLCGTCRKRRDRWEAKGEAA